MDIFRLFFFIYKFSNLLNMSVLYLTVESINFLQQVLRDSIAQDIVDNGQWTKKALSYFWSVREQPNNSSRTEQSKYQHLNCQYIRKSRRIIIRFLDDLFSYFLPAQR